MRVQMTDIHSGTGAVPDWQLHVATTPPDFVSFAPIQDFLRYPDIYSSRILQKCPSILQILKNEQVFSNPVPVPDS